MTAAANVSTGSGKQAYRLEIEGYPSQWTTDPALDQALTGAYAGVTRRSGLLTGSMMISERVYPAEGRLEQEGNTFEIVDIDGRPTIDFTTKPTRRAQLTALATAVATEFQVDSSAILIDGYYRIGTEVVQVTARPTSTTVTVVRARWGTTAQIHYVETGAKLAYPEITDYPVLMTGSRVTVYEYGEGDDPLGDGTQRWRGVVASEPAIGGSLTTWTITADPPWSLLDQEVAADADEPMRVSGIYYAWSGALTLKFQRAINGSGAADVDADSGFLHVTGHYDDQASFCDAVNDILAASGASWLSAVTAQPSADGGWELVLQTPAVSPRWIYALVYSGVDGLIRGDDLVDGDDAPVYSVAANLTYRYKWRGEVDDQLPFRPRRVPRAAYSSLAGHASGDRNTIQNAMATAPNTRIYLDRAANLGIGNELVIEDGEVATNLTISAVSTNGYVDTTQTVAGVFGGGDDPTTITSATSYGIGTLETFRAALIAKATEANAGSTPFIHAGDLADWSAVVSEISTAYLERRKYMFTQPVNLAELLAEEFKIYRVFPYTDSSGKIAIRVLTQAASTETTIATLGQDEHVNDVDDFGAISANPDGAINTVTIKTGWDQQAQEHTGQTYHVRDVRSISRLKKRRAIEIAPMVESEVEPGLDDAASIASGVMALYGTRYEIVTLKVPRTRFNVLLGDIVDLDIEHIPYDGARGIDTNAMVIGRKWNLSEAFGEFTVLISSLDVAGYSPTGRVASQANVTGNQWDITLTATYYATTGETDASKFAGGDRVKAVEWDATVPVTKSGTVDSVTGNVVRVTFTAPWTPGASIWTLIYDSASSAQTSQLAYSYCAAADGRITVTTSANVFAP